jgi:glycine/D-amino acid oxidase-like deaminating enzyme
VMTAAATAKAVAVVHCYGHGGSGWTVMHGTAEAAADLVDTAWEQQRQQRRRGGGGVGSRQQPPQWGQQAQPKPMEGAVEGAPQARRLQMQSRL